MCDDRNAALLLHTCCSPPLHFSVCWLMRCGIYFNLHDLLRKTCLRYEKKGSPVFFFMPDLLIAFVLLHRRQLTTQKGFKSGLPRLPNTVPAQRREHRLQDTAFASTRAFPLPLSLTQSWLVKTDGSWACNSSVYKTNRGGRQALNPTQVLTQSCVY